MQSLEHLIVSLAYSLPLEVFVIVGSFLEEVVAPIPSPSIMVIAGSFGAVQGYAPEGLLMLVFLASIGKTLGGLVMYHIAATLKDAAVPALERHIGITNTEIERFGSRFTGSARDYAIYIFFRSVPIIPSILLSFGSGVIRLPLRLFIIGTFAGTVVRDSFYIVVGYTGIEILQTYLANTTYTEGLVQNILAVLIGSAALYLVYRRKKKKTDHH